MSHSDYENEQVEEAKAFLKENGKFIIITCVIGFGAVFGWRFWQSYQEKQLMKSAEQFEQLVSELDADKRDSMTKLADFNQDASNIYGVLGALALAKQYVEQENYTDAQKQLILAAEKNKDAAVKPMIDFRLARVQFQQKAFDDALKTLDKITDPAWQVESKILRADIFVAQNHFSDALDLYGLALTTAATPVQAEEIEMKINQTRYLKATYEAKVEEEKAEEEKAESAKKGSAK